jgi:hypothetical protein
MSYHFIYFGEIAIEQGMNQREDDKKVNGVSKLIKRGKLWGDVSKGSGSLLYQRYSSGISKACSNLGLGFFLRRA